MLAKDDKTRFFAEARDVLQHCPIPCIEWLLSHRPCEQLLQDIRDPEIVIDLMIAIFRHQHTAAVLTLLSHTHHCKQFSVPGSFFQKSQPRDLFTGRIIGEADADMLLTTLFAILQCRAPILAIECEPCRSGQRPWNILRSLMDKAKEGYADRMKTARWIKAVAVCFSFAWSKTIHIDTMTLLRVVALALSSPPATVFEAELILSKCAAHVQSCSNHCTITAASRMCMPTETTAFLVERFVSKVEQHYPD